MKSFSIEIVPRTWDYLTEQFSAISSTFPLIDTLNVPDLLRFDIRSWEACSKAKPYFKTVIPHLRAIDFDLKTGFSLLQYLKEHAIQNVLVITGDKPQEMNRKIYRNTSCELIRLIKKELPAIKIYSSIDQYRSGIRDEIDYVHDKLEAGADGFFTQPFFDLNFLKMYVDILAGTEVYWGISPVTSIQSKMYWESKNNAVFPSGFEPSLDWNINFAQRTIDILESVPSNVYFMPIRVSAVEYLGKVLNPKF
ncbi:MAG: methylenetetrahydrofolate reductase [Fibrobacter sp.]|nr:methylenetetrahydrofolate reductase [Fibrobacter sp.]